MTIVFMPMNPLIDISSFISALVMIVTSLVVIFKIKSKSYFAYTLMALTVAQGVALFGIGFTNLI